MAEPPAAAQPRAAASQRDVLLATKLHVPRPQPGFVPRPRLTKALDEGLARRLILVCAPAGFGKTALLAHWARSGDRPVAWLSLDAADNDPARFWRHAVAALDRVRPGIGERAAPLVGPPTPRSFDGLVTALINELAAWPGEDEVLLVLDDYHLIDAEQVHAPLEFLVEHLPPGLHLVLAGRADPPLPLARLRAGLLLAELRAAELRFTAGEAESLLGASIGADLDAAAVAALTSRTEGWAVGLQLAALSLRGQGDPAGFVAAFSGSHRYVLDYLAEEVLDRQSEQVRTFLLETSVLERLSGPLCDAVTGRAGGQAMLEQVEQAGLFLAPLDEVRGWWRYHHLFADLLHARLQAERPGQIPALHRAAAAWCEEHGLADDAVHHVVAAGDAARAARLIERHADDLMLRGEDATLQRWLAALPAELVRSRPRLCAAQAWKALLAADVEAAEVALDAAERASEDAAAGPFDPSVGPAASLLVNVPAAIALERAYLAELRGDANGTAAFASQALASLGKGERMLHSVTRLQLAVADWLGGLTDQAERALLPLIAQWRAADERSFAIRGCYLLAQVQRTQGKLDAAARTYRQAGEIGAPPDRPALPAAGIGSVCLAELAYQRNELDAAFEHVTEGIADLQQLNYTVLLASGLATLAWIRQARGDQAGALEAMGEAERVAPGPSVGDRFNPIPAHRARLMLAQGDVAAAARWAEAHGLNPGDEPAFQREREYLVLARILLAQHRPGPALALLDRLHTAAETQHRTGSVIEIRVLQALALAASREEPAAVDALAGALILACPQGYVRLFADEGPPMGALLGRLVAAQRAEQGAARGVPLDCLAQVLRAFGEGHAAPPSVPHAPSAVPGLVEPLTTRELEVLTLLAAGAPNQDIARELVVSLDTAKKHVSHVLSKLGAANRTQAVTRARQLGIIP
jgi:LuxR family transcriptional regulator, maltose regulon positive regulatory protein